MAAEVAMELSLFDEYRKRPMSDESKVALVASIAHEIGLQERHDELWAMHAPTADDIAAKGDHDG